ncbi:MAG: ATP-NAD kinase family protein [Thermoplasmata archaeon]
MKIGFVVNPIAGMGGSVGLKGTDNVLDEAIRRGAKKVSPIRAREFVKNSYFLKEHEIYTCGGEMGREYFDFDVNVVYKTDGLTTSTDTKNCIKNMGDIEILLFVGGDGTARDVYSVSDRKYPILGIPSGVKVYSSVFATSPRSASDVLKCYIEKGCSLTDREILDVDEEAYRNNELKIKLYGIALTPYLDDKIQNSKAEIYSTDDEEDKQGIAEFILDNMDNSLYLIGPGTTPKKVMELLNLRYTLLGFDAIKNKTLIKMDLTERDIIELIEKYGNIKVIITPIGGQGYIFGRGNLQLTTDVLSRLNKEDIIIVATPAKLSSLKYFLIDLNDEEIEKKFSGYYRVIFGYGRIKMVKAIYF